jgi:peptidoglycan/LPS O-acetylase OafA/YrhL
MWKRQRPLPFGFPNTCWCRCFFALSGFLVAGSGMRLSTKNFLLNRAARILPALVADIVFAALLIGPLVTKLPVKQYFTDTTFFTYFLNITGWVQYSLPGVFENIQSQK